MEKCRVGVIGCKGIGIRHASGLIGLDNAELAAGCDVAQETLEAFQEHWQGVWPNLALYTDYREMLEVEDLDMVTVAASDPLHAQIVVDAANAGVKGIYCEKPMATSLEDADRMLEAVERNGVILTVDHTRRWQPLWRHIKEEIVGKGEIGPVQNIVARLGGHRAMLFRNGTHLIDTVCYFADSDPEWVFAVLEPGYEGYTEYRGTGRDPETEPAANGYIHFANGVQAFYVGGSKTTPGAFTLEIVGTDGSVRTGGMEGEATLYKDGSAEPIRPPEWEVSGIPAGAREMVKLLTEGGESVSPGREALKVVEIMVGFLESQRRGNAKVHLPLPRE